jgi:DNA-binding response OmpR family regulator
LLRPHALLQEIDEFVLTSNKIMDSIMVPLILMIENDEDDRLLTKEHFQMDWPEALIEFLSPLDLPHRLRRLGRRPQLIILSMGATPYNGIDLIRQIRGELEYASCPIIVLSETALPEEIRASYSAGASSFIKKPSAYADTLAKIKAFIAYWAHTVELPGPLV